jgi:hypothetical protein
MHTIMSKKFYLGPKFGTLFNKKWITISELLHELWWLSVTNSSQVYKTKINKVSNQYFCDSYV